VGDVVAAPTNRLVEMIATPSDSIDQQFFQLFNSPLPLTCESFGQELFQLRRKKK
jgi:hypothetical protein